jgi:hypothetical protein
LGSKAWVTEFVMHGWMLAGCWLDADWMLAEYWLDASEICDFVGISLILEKFADFI